METITKESLQSSIPESWKLIIQQELNKPYWDKIVSNLNDGVFYPPVKNIFSALEGVAPDRVKVVLLGQDPYPTKGAAHGYSFSIQKGNKIQPSLKNIFKELSDEYMTEFEPKSGDLRKWETEGVLLLNTILTVKPESPLSHQNIGWENFTGAILKFLASRENVLFLLLGSKARDAVSKFNIDDKRKIIAGHPSPLNRTGSFNGSGCFRAVNEELLRRKILPIRWFNL